MKTARELAVAFIRQKTGDFDKTKFNFKLVGYKEPHLSAWAYFPISPPGDLIVGGGCMVVVDTEERSVVSEPPHQFMLEKSQAFIKSEYNQRRLATEAQQPPITS
ncbi:hypothetical protein [Rothia nasimurium]|uniref:hypothetical protein n=1 Tax=Rothia nasimurium TaxID=85336 RepID=UPI001F36C707|nr:hypothetical protein [Rothia nasimurium]